MKFNISVNFPYQLIFSRDIFQASNPTLFKLLSIDSEGKRTLPRCIVFLDDGLSRAQPNLSKEIEFYFDSCREWVCLSRSPVLIPGGERAKQSLALLQEVISSVNQAHICRHSFVIAVGGGSVIDLVSFAASIIHRGVRQIRIPSTVLAQDDAGIGIKNGIDLFNQKNFLGSFSPPYAVINDSNFLATLNQSDWIGGVSEAIKVALIKDRSFCLWIFNHANDLKSRNLNIMSQMIQRCAELHLEHICGAGDPFESGSARPLDFGHWVGHKLESLSNYSLSHGHAVATGIMTDLIYSELKGWTPTHVIVQVFSCLRQIGFILWQDLLLKTDESQNYLVLEGLEDFRVHLGGELSITLVKDFGESFQVNEMDSDIIINSILRLRDLERPAIKLKLLI